MVSPEDKKIDSALWVYQQAYFSLGIFDSNQSVVYNVKIAGNGVYAFLIEGEIEIDQNALLPRDALGITDATAFEINFKKESKLLLVEVPMTQN